VDPDATLQNLRSAIRAWQEAVVAGSTEAAHDAAADAITAANDLDYWLSRGGYLPATWAPQPPAPLDADAAYATYAEAISRFARAVEANIARRIHADFPTAVHADVVGEYREDDYELHLRLVAVRGRMGVLADDTDGELWNALTNEAEPDLGWLAQLEPDDWTGPHQLDLSRPPSIPSPRAPEGDRS
jgi:hypothetical protein